MFQKYFDFATLWANFREMTPPKGSGMGVRKNFNEVKYFHGLLIFVTLFCFLAFIVSQFCDLFFLFFIGMCSTFVSYTENSVVSEIYLSQKLKCKTFYPLLFIIFHHITDRRYFSFSICLPVCSILWVLSVQKIHLSMRYISFNSYTMWNISVGYWYLLLCPAS